MPKILIGGYYGAGNTGDEAILESLLVDLRTMRADLDFIVTSWNPEETSRQYSVKAIRWKDINALLEAGQKADLIILGGGGLFQDYWGLEPDTYLRRGFGDITAYGSLPLLAKLLGVPCMIYAVGLGPLQSDSAQQHTRLAFERCQVATLRDDKSLALLQQTGFHVRKGMSPHIEILPDPAFSLTISPADEMEVTHFLHQLKLDPEAELVGIALRYWDHSGSPTDWLPYVAKGLDLFLARNPRTQAILVPFQLNRTNPYTDDAAIHKTLFRFMTESMRVHLIEERVSPRFVQALFKSCSVVLGMRLHALIFGINAGTPIVALPYDPKVSSLMEQGGLEEYCCVSLTPKPEDLAAKLQKAVYESRDEMRSKMDTLRAEWCPAARKNAVLAIKLLEKFRRKPMTFGQEFAVEQLRLLEKVDQAQDQLKTEKDALQSRVWELQAQGGELQSRVWELDALRDQLEKEKLPLQSQVQSQGAELERLNAKLYDIESSIFWKLGRLPHRFSVMLKHEGIRRTLHKTLEVIRMRPQIITPNDGKVDEVMANILSNLNLRSLKGVFVVTSAFVFDEFYNQRVINLSKYLAMEGWGVIYVAWVWHDSSEAPPDEVMENIFQIPSNLFLASYAALERLQIKPRYFVAEFPHPEFLAAALKLRRYDFKIIYEIIDEWEEFHKVDQAIWFRKAIEESLVVNANYLTAVSQPLVDKFSALRKDIHLIPNGFDPTFLGDHQDIAKRNFSEAEIHLGYFGHLTDSWFDWGFLLEVLDLAGQYGLNLQVHLIGYGEPNLEKRLANYWDRIHLHGKIPPAELYQYVKDWDVAMIPFKSGKLSEAVDPIKIYEYLYFGLPVIVKGITHLKEFPNITVVTNAEQFIETIGHLRELKKIKSESINLVEFTWKQRFSRLLRILESNKWMSL